MRSVRRPSSVVATLLLAMAAVAGSPPSTVRAADPAFAPHAAASHERSTEAPRYRGAIDVRRSSASGPGQAPSNDRPAARPIVTGPEVDPTFETFAADSPVEATTTGAPAAGLPGWTGLASTDNLPDQLDPAVAVGPEHVVQTANRAIRMWDRSGNLALSAFLDAAKFFDLPSNVQNGQPRIVYDSLHGRWVVTEESYTCVGTPTGYLDFMVSRTADPTGMWDGYFYAFEGEFPADPTIGTSTDKLTFTADFRALVNTLAMCGPNVNGAYHETDVLITDWTDVLATGGSNHKIDTRTYSFADAGDYTRFQSIRVAVQEPATSSSLFMVVLHDDGVTRTPYYARVIGSAVSNTITFPTEGDLSANDIVAPWANAAVPLQPGAIAVRWFDARPSSAIWQAGHLTWVSTNACTPSGDTVGRACVRVTQIGTAGGAGVAPTPEQDFLIGESGAYHFMGGIARSIDGSLHVVWTRSADAPGGQPSSLAGYQRSEDPANAMSTPEVLAPGSGVSYEAGRWADFIGVAQDPSVVNSVWQGNMYSTGQYAWGSLVSQLQTGGSTYVPIDPVRILDSRSNVGVTGKFASSVGKSFQVTGVDGIPAEAIAVTGNVTVTGQTAPGYVSITTNPSNTPQSSTINFPKGETRANNATVPVASDGRLSAVYKAASGSTTQIIFDVTGYFVAGAGDAAYNPMAPVRLLDTRPGVGNAGLVGPFVSGTPRQLPVAGIGSIPADAVAITANLTVVHPSRGGYVAVTPTSDDAPSTSNINFPTGDTRANGLTTKLDSGAVWLVYKAPVGATTDLLLDVTGYYLAAGDGLAFYPMTAGRIFDTRTSTLSGLHGKFAANTPRTLDTTGHWGVPDGAAAVTGNLTVTGQTKNGYVAITPDPTTTPATSTINFPKGDTRANGVTVPLNGSGNVSLVYKAPSGTTNLILDLTGYFK